MSFESVPPGPPAAAEAEQPAGWFPDPNGRHEHRYFNGRTWTADVADGGLRSIDPLGWAPAPFGHPGYVAAGARPERNGVATAALVCGIIGVCLAWMPFIVVAGFVLSVLALVFGVRGVRRAHVTDRGRGQAVAGVVLGAVGAVLSVVGVVLSVAVWRELGAFLDPAPHVVADEECRVVDGVATATGTITNRSDSPQRFTVFAEIMVDGERSEHFDEIGPLAPGASAVWDVRNFVGGFHEACGVEVEVYGPFPFDTQMDRL